MFGALDENERWDSIELQPGANYGHPNPWRLKGQVVGTESVKVPAGKFTSIKVVVTGD